MKRREELAHQIRVLAAKHTASGWTSRERAEWDELCTQYDIENMAESNRIDEEQRRLTAGIRRQGHDESIEARWNRTGGVKPGEPARASDPDLALAAWARCAHGHPIPHNEFERAIGYGCDPRASAFEIRLPTGSPTAGLRFAPVNSQSVATGSAGGFTVPSTVLGRLESAMRDRSGMLRSSEIWITEDGREAHWPAIDDTSNSGYQVGEGVASDEVDLEFTALRYSAYKMSSGVVRASHELLRDSAVNLSLAIADKLGERLARILNSKATNGSGAGTVSGILPRASVGVTTASQTAITFDELAALQHSVDVAYRSIPGSAWMMNDLVALEIRKLKDGEGRPLWSDSMQDGQPPRLMGFDVIVNNDMPSTLAAGNRVVLFGSLRHYKLRIVSGVRLRVLQERYSIEDQTGFLGFLEIDGQLLVPSSDAALCPVRALQMAS